MNRAIFPDALLAAVPTQFAGGRVNFALFLTNNWANLDYGTTAGHAETHSSTFPGGISPRPTCWVRTDFSATSIHHIGCHEVGHLLGLAHNNALYSISGGIPRYSFMVSGFNGEAMMALRWFDSASARAPRVW